MVIILDLLHPIVWLVRHVCCDKAEFSFLQKKTAFWCSFKCVPNWRLVCPIYSLSLSLHGIEYIVLVHFSFVTGSLGLAKICPKVWKVFWATLRSVETLGLVTFCRCYSFLSSPSWLKMSLIYSRKYMLSNYRSEKFKQHCNHSNQWCIVKWLLLLSCLKWFLFVSLLSLLSYNLN